MRLDFWNMEREIEELNREILLRRVSIINLENRVSDLKCENQRLSGILGNYAVKEVLKTKVGQKFYNLWVKDLKEKKSLSGWSKW